MRRPRKAVLLALERVFAAEIMGNSYQMRPSKLREELIERGLITEPQVLRVGTLRVEELVTLTHAGRMLYGQYCEVLPGED